MAVWGTISLRQSPFKCPFKTSQFLAIILADQTYNCAEDIRDVTVCTLTTPHWLQTTDLIFTIIIDIILKCHFAFCVKIWRGKKMCKCESACQTQQIWQENSCTINWLRCWSFCLPEQLLTHVVHNNKKRCRDERGNRQHSQVHQLSSLTFFGHTEGLLHWFGPPSIITCIADLKQDSMATTDFFKRPQYACTHLTETTQKQITKSSKVTRRTNPSAQEKNFTMKTNPPRRWEIC